MYKRKHLFVMVILLALILAACSSSATTQQSETANTAVEQSNENQESLESEVEEGSIEDNENENEDDDFDEKTESEDEMIAAGGLTLVIVPEESEARFIIDEVLSGADKIVVGTTTAVEGAITADKDNPAAVSVSAVKVDMSTLSTDSSFRNRAITDFILQTGEPDNQFATFVPTGYQDLPESITIGESFTFQITGNLTIHGVTQEETFEVTLTPVSETRIEGTATLSDVTYADYGIHILRLPTQVASVEDTVTLELSFVAAAQ